MDADPILREVHRMKDQVARKYGYDITKMCEHFRKEAQKHPERMVLPPPKTAAPGKRRPVKKKTVE